MPRKPQNVESIDSRKEGLVGRAALYAQITRDMKELDRQKKDLRGKILSEVKELGRTTNSGYELEEAGVKITLQVQTRDKFDTTAALDVLNTLTEEEAGAYLKQTTDSDLMAAAFMQKAVTGEQLSTCFSESVVEVLKVEDKK